MKIRRGKGPRINRGEQFVLSGKTADLWQEIVAAERASLFATPRRCAEIERRQPEALERGRPLFYVPDTSARRTQHHHRVEKAEPSPQNGRPIWRKTFSFEGQEELLADAGEDLVVAEQDEDLADEECEMAVAAD